MFSPTKRFFFFKKRIHVSQAGLKPSAGSTTGTGLVNRRNMLLSSSINGTYTTNLVFPCANMSQYGLANKTQMSGSTVAIKCD